MARILVCDDSSTDRKLVAAALEEHTIIEAASGEEAIEIAKQLRPDLVILDVIMPGKNGFQTCRELRRMSETSSVPIIILTTKHQPTDKDWAMRQGATGYIVKPFSDADLLAAVSSNV
jgi:twitching motility two-component system response regulator PilH